MDGAYLVESIDYMSLSARRAWIEISLDDILAGVNEVALRKESVDRNTHNAQAMKGGIMSLSARRAWIEILSRDSDGAYIVVALRKESVDRNAGKLDADLWVMWSLSARRAWIEIVLFVNGDAQSSCRSPQGERG